MAQFPFVGASYTARSKNFDAQRCLNLFPALQESGTSKSVAALYGTPGLRLWLALGAGTVRGMLRFNPLIGIIIRNGTVYKVTPGAVPTNIGSVAAGTGQVSMASNGIAIMVVTGGTDGYFIDPVAGTVTAITDTDFIGGNKVAFLDGYFVWNKLGTGQFQITSVYGTTIEGLDFATAEGAPDNLLSLIVDHREVWLFGETTTEVFYNSGNQDFPIERIQGAFLEHGCAAPDSVAKMDNSVFWLSADERGRGMVMRAMGYTPERVSTHALEYAIGQMSTISDATAYTYQQEGHSFYVLTFPTADQTWVFDASTNLWHERAWRDPLTNFMRRHRSNCQMQFAGYTLVGDFENGNVYVLDMDTFTDNGDPIARIRSCPHLSRDYKWQFFSALQIDMQTGVGLVDGQGSDPQAMLQWSDDGGYVYGTEFWKSIGRIGERRARVRWRRLGKSRDRVFKLTITDPIRVVIVGASVEFTVGKS